MISKRYVKGISFIEYTMVMVIVVAALVGIQIYLKRAICGRWRQTADSFGFGRQYNAPNIRIWGR